MKTRQNIYAALLIFLTFIAFASYHEGTGSTAWLQWTSVTVMVAFAFFFDFAFTDSSSFIFDPDADNWRRKTDAVSS